nr:MAG TPA: ATP-dependent exoDNAse [Caudoviricetes sp.]
MGVESATSETGPWKQSTHPTSSRSGTEYSHGGRMTNLTWYSTEKADKTFATKVELEALRKASEGRQVDTSVLATKEEVTRGDDALSGLNNALLYTAITRARERFVFWGNEEQWRMAVETRKTRRTALGDILDAMFVPKA